MHDESNYDYQQYLIKLQESNVLDGITNEPRVFYDTITTGLPLVEVNGHAECFRNGEDFPVRITHILMAMKRLRFDPEGGEFVPLDPRIIQRMGLRLKFHDQYYMNQYASNPVGANIPRQIFVAASGWALQPTAASDIVSNGSSAWEFQRPFILSVRDTIRVDLKLDEAPGAEVGFFANVSFTGRGVISQRPYFRSGILLLTDAIRQTLDTENFRNDGSEPVMITNMTVTITGAVPDADQTGDISRLSVGIRQIGNGTNAAWVQGPVNDPTIVPDLVPAVVLGQQSGRAIVHRFPGHGLLWAPGEGITAEIQSLDTSGASIFAAMHIAMLGYISVQ